MKPRTNTDSRPVLASRGSFLALAVSLACLGCHDSSSSPVFYLTQPIAGKVSTAWGSPVSGARVYLVPSNQVPTTAITSADVLSGASEPYDEPLEDVINSPAASMLPQGTTNASGAFSIPAVDTTESYYPYVDVSGASPADLYPGGSLCRVARTGTTLTLLDIEVTGHPSPAATYLGSTTCLVCHPDYSSQSVHAHRLGFRKPGQTGALQDLTWKPGFDDGLAFFKLATTADFKTEGTSLWYYNYDGTRGFDKFEIALSDPGGAEIQVYLWRNSANGKYMISMQNLATPADPDRSFVIDLTYGGALYKQRYMLAIPDPGYAGRYPFLQYQHAGDDSYYDRTRKVWRDYHMDFFWDAGTQTFKFPDKTKNIESNCMACHATGYSYFTDPVTTERMCDAVDDASGVFDIDGDGQPDEINTGCEVCHGPGSEHASTLSPRAIVKPNFLSPGRENQICGRCHDRVAGNDDRTNDQPLNAMGEMAPPGTSRAEFLADYTSRMGPKLSSFWVDEFHSKSHHQQYPDFVKSEHYRNSRRLVACSNCHDLHGKGAYQCELRGDPKDGTLCAQCHVIDINEHLVTETGSLKTGMLTSCTSCHYYKIAKTGAGSRGILLGAPTGAPSDADITYWMNDISSHHTVIARKDNPGIAGVTPGSAMPVPYVNDCGTCHDARFLQFEEEYR